MPAFIIEDLAFGDSGKGTLVDYLCRKHNALTVVRYNGGAQAGHNVKTPDGKVHTFSQIGSGAFAGVPTFTSRHCMVDPCTFLSEYNSLRAQIVIPRVTVDERCLVTTPFHIAANRILESVRTQKHGSCGMGVGMTRELSLLARPLAIYVEDLFSPTTVLEKLRDIQRCLMIHQPLVSRENSLGWAGLILEDKNAPTMIMHQFDKYLKLVEVAKRGHTPLDRAGELSDMNPVVIFEGAQGALLDEKYGFYPHNTWTNTLSQNAVNLCSDVGITDITTIGAIRASLTRHGAGPFPTQISTNELDNPHERNVYNAWQQNFKKGWQDLELIRYAIKMHKLEGLNIDQLAVTCLDALPDRTSVCTNYEKPVLPDVPITDLGALSRLSRSLSEATPVYDVVSKDRVAHYLSDQLGIPLMITSHGPTHLEKKS